MKKVVYETPVMELIMFENEDVLTISGGIDEGDVVLGI